MTGAGTVAVLRASQRQLNAANAVWLGMVAEVGSRGLDSEDEVVCLAAPDRWGADEVRTALRISAYTANELLDFAWAVVRRFPKLHAAMTAGELSIERARVIHFWVRDMTDEHANTVIEEVLGHCSIDADRPWTSEQIGTRCRKLGIQLDPDWAQRRFAEAHRERRVISWRNEDGTATLAAQNQDPARVAAAIARVRKLADDAKRAGDPRPLDHLRSEIALNLLDGTYADFTDEQILAHLATTRPTEDEHDQATETDDTEETDEGDAFEPEPQPAPEPESEPEPQPEPAPEPESELEPQPEPQPEPAPESAPEPESAPVARSPHHGVQLTAKLSTLLGLDRDPAELAGQGPIHAELARDLAQQLSAGQWRFAVTGPDGYAVSSGLVSARPIDWERRRTSDHGIVDLLIPATLLQALLDEPVTSPEVALWRPVLVEIGRHHLLATASAENETAPEDPEDARRRFPRQGLRRDTQLRMTTCQAPGCRLPAARSEIDHTLDHARGGLTLAGNLGPLCEHDHDLKTKGGWQLIRLGHDRVRWITRLGVVYDVEIPPLIEPDPPGQASAPGDERQPPRPAPDEPAA
ncbi:HNH endonuclease signature motif containing protein [Sporichthya polymorpha]|uniref:HNH endonuclease signature motif containing protein n=1 Tax=Sporichthya polymorpha TaxID=35751 RepID=UPI000379AA97|nr:HNH endonuclease signature motif containing protein [Sporichthya polymorpha]